MEKLKDAKIINAILAALAVISFMSMDFIDIMGKLQLSGMDAIKYSEGFKSFVFSLYIIIPIAQAVISFISKDEKLIKLCPISMFIPVFFTFFGLEKGLGLCGGFWWYLIFSILAVIWAYKSKNIIEVFEKNIKK